MIDDQDSLEETRQQVRVLRGRLKKKQAGGFPDLFQKKMTGKARLLLQ
ncbi:MAG: hypothetical protein V2B13_03395 [Pseudomonadota bacterium]